MRHLLIIFFCLGQLAAWGQRSYSYVSDRKFKDPTDLIGYNFRPGMLEVPDEGIKRELPAGSYSFGLSGNNLYVKGEGIKGVYNVNNINTTGFGFIMKLINARDARIQGHLKVILNNKDQVDALVFRRTQNEPEMIFFQQLIDETFAEQEKAYFTDLHEMLLEKPDSIWGKTIRPFLRITRSLSLQERLRKADSTFIFFEKVTHIDTKTRTKKVKDEEKLPELEENETISVDTNGIATITETLISYSFFVNIQTIVTYNDGNQEKKTQRFEIKNVKEREDEMATVDEPRFQIELKTASGEDLYLFLLGDRTISSFEVSDVTYWVRGY
jgi:hypothetical protein